VHDRLPVGKQHSIVGKEQVSRSREMHWIRLDTYFKRRTGNPKARSSPTGAVHALRERALRTGLSRACDRPQREGLNDMVYNRCVGTKYCSNNCPYKVRRFNFFLYQDGNSRLIS